MTGCLMRSLNSVLQEEDPSPKGAEIQWKNVQAQGTKAYLYITCGGKLGFGEKPQIIAQISKDV